MIDIKIVDEFRVSPYNACRIMGGTLGLTDKQQEELDKLILKRDTSKVTPLQEKKIEELLEKKDAVEISQGAKTYVEEWLNEKIYGIRKPRVNTKEMSKGLMCEDDAIQYFADCIGEDFLLKNNRKVDNGLFRGACDIELDDSVVDIKVPWSNETMPIFEERITNLTYLYQLHAYMWLYDKRKATLAYVLMDTPLELVEKEARFEYYSPMNKKKFEEVLEDWKKVHTFEHLPMELRLKTFDLEYNEGVIEEFKIRAELCKDYARKFINKLNNK